MIYIACMMIMIYIACIMIEKLKAFVCATLHKHDVEKFNIIPKSENAYLKKCIYLHYEITHLNFFSVQILTFFFFFGCNYTCIFGLKEK